MQWRMIVPFRAGKVNAVAVVPGMRVFIISRLMSGGVLENTELREVRLETDFLTGPVASIGANWRLAPRTGHHLLGTRVNPFLRQQLRRWSLQVVDGWENWKHMGLSTRRHIKNPIDPAEYAVCGAGAAMGHSFVPGRTTLRVSFPSHEPEDIGRSAL